MLPQTYISNYNMTILFPLVVLNKLSNVSENYKFWRC